MNSLGSHLSLILEKTANITLEFAELKANYSNKSMLDATLIFQSVIIDKMFDYNKGLPQKKQEELAMECGYAIRELVLKYTCLDLHKLENEQ